VNRTTERRAHAYAVRAMRKLGRELTSGTWAQSKPQGNAESQRIEPQPLSVNEAVTVIVRASAIVMRLGIDSVIASADEALGRMVGSLLGDD
jgi:hypothetical protein